MFTVCPKCALTLVVTAQDLRVAQGYVRCGRCSNVFNAIAGLTDDRGALAASARGAPSTAASQEAPASAQDEPQHDPLSETGETEAIYAEPDADEVRFQEVFTEPTPPAPAARAPAPRAPDAEVSFAAPPPAQARPPATASTATKRPPEPQRRYSDTEGTEKRYSDTDGIEQRYSDAEGGEKRYSDSEGIEKRYSDTEGIETVPEHELEFNPNLTDVTKVFVEAAPVTFRGNATGQFEKIVPPSAATASSATAPGRSAASARAPATPKKSAPDARPPRDEEDVQIDDDLRTLAAHLDVTASRPVPGTVVAANDEETAEVRDTPRGTPLAGDDDEIRAEGVADAFAPAQPARARTLLWVAGAAVLSLGLVAQVIHHNRHELATNASLNRPLTRFYKAIGVPLVPSWDLALYDVRQLGASTNEGSAGTLTVRASLKNTARQPLPLPLLRITMQDRYGNRIATRDVLPTGYVPGAVPPDAHLGAGQRLDAEMTFKDPGQDAVGFEIDACLPTASGRIACANDAALAAR